MVTPPGLIVCNTMLPDRLKLILALKTIKSAIEKATGNSLKARSGRSTITLGFGTFAERVLRLVRNMILARLLAPSEFGLMAIIIAASTAFCLFNAPDRPAPSTMFRAGSERSRRGRSLSTAHYKQNYKFFTQINKVKNRNYPDFGGNWYFRSFFYRHGRFQA